MKHCKKQKYFPSHVPFPHVVLHTELSTRVSKTFSPFNSTFSIGAGLQD
jgi:hypothetical protein